MGSSDFSGVAGRAMVAAKKKEAEFHGVRGLVLDVHIALAAPRRGCKIRIETGLTSPEVTTVQLGIIVHPLSVDQSSASLIDVGSTFMQVVSVFKNAKTDLVSQVAIKPVLAVGIVARFNDWHSGGRAHVP